MATSRLESLTLNDEEKLVHERLSGCFDEERKRVAKLLDGKDDSNLLARRSTISATGFTPWGQRPWKSPPTSGKKSGTLQASAVCKTCNGCSLHFARASVL